MALQLPRTVAGLDDELDAALARHGLCARRIAELAPPDASKRGRSALRVELDDGRTIKARRLESAEAARRLHELRAGLDPAFAPSIGYAGRILLEEWVAGAPLTAADEERWLEPAAALLARLHATPLAGAPPPPATRPWREDGERDLAQLEQAGLLARREREALVARLAESDPGRAPVVLAHQDFCADNMIVDAAGALRVIDNEWLALQPAGMDLGRTACRWPMAPEAWRRFLDAYRAQAPADPGPLAFWEILALAATGRIRLRRSAAHAAGVRDRLLRVLAGPLPGELLP